MPAQPNAICERCNRSIHIKPSRLASGRGRYCSRRCTKPYEGRPPAEWFYGFLKEDAGCLIWTGALDSDGYGQLPHIVHATWGTTRKAHRLAYALANGELPSKGEACHTCDRPACCTTEHLFNGSRSDNSKDMHAKGRGPANPILGKHGELNPWAKLTNDDVRVIRQRYAAAIPPGHRNALRNSNTVSLLAQEFGVTTGCIHNVVSGRTYAATPGAAAD